MRAADLDEAIRWQNQPAYGLTAGLHALDPAEIERWREQVRAGNLYVNRGTTGAIVRRQPFGGLEALGGRARAPRPAAPTTWPAWGAGRSRRGGAGPVRTAGRVPSRPGRTCGWPGTRPGWLPRPTPFATARWRGWCCAGGAGSLTPWWPAPGRPQPRWASTSRISSEAGGRWSRPATWGSTRSGFLGAVADSTRLAALDAGLVGGRHPRGGGRRPGDPALGPGAGGQRDPAPARQRHRPAAGACRRRIGPE